MDWSGKIIFITGASSGIGSELARQFAAEGAILGLLARRKEMLDALTDEITQAGGKAKVFAADVTDEKAVHSAAEALRKEFGRIDVLIANAGIGGISQRPQDIKTKDFAHVINVNLIGAVNAVTAVLPAMIERKNGHLVAVSSLAAYGGLPKAAAYCASKAAMTKMFESLRVDLQGSGISVTTIHPGFIKTPLTAGREAQMPFLMELKDAAEKMIRIIEKKKPIAAFPFPLSTMVRLGQIFPVWLYDLIVRKNSFRE